MNTRIHISLLAFLAIFVLFAFPPIKHALPGELELDDAQNVKLSRQKAKLRITTNDKGEDYINESSDAAALSETQQCGSIGIGNVINPTAFSTPSEINLIITGDIINANIDCR